MEAILHIGIAQFLFASFLLLINKRRKVADVVLVLWLLLMTIFMFLTLFKSEFEDSLWGRLQLYPFFYSIGPFLYLYVRSLSLKKAQLYVSDLLHMLPFAFFSVLAVVLDSKVDEDILLGNSFNLNRLFYSLSAILSFITYSTLTLGLIRKHQENILNLFSYRSELISLNWVRFVVIGFFVILALTMLAAVFNVFSSEMTLNPGIFLFLGFTLFAFAVTVYGIRQPGIFESSRDQRFVDHLAEQSHTEAETSESEKSGKYARSGLSENQAKRNAGHLLSYMEEKQPYLRRDLTVQDVARETGIPQHHLTQTINEQLGKNFYSLVNEFRVEEVKRVLKDPKKQHLTLLALAHDAGFNSKSSFNMVFKRITGLTPSQFRDA